MEYAGDDGAEIGRSAEACCDPVGKIAAPVGTDEQIEAGLRPVHGPDVSVSVGPLVAGLKDIEAIAKVRNLYDDRLASQIEDPKAVDQVLARTGDVALAGIDALAEHGEPVDRRHRGHAAYEKCLGLDPVLRPVTVVDVHERPGPEIGKARQGANILGRIARSRRRVGRQAESVALARRSRGFACGKGLGMHRQQSTKEIQHYRLSLAA